MSLVDIQPPTANFTISCAVYQVFMEVLADMSADASTMSGQYLTKLFEDSDDNGDGVLQFDEFYNLLGIMMKQLFDHTRTLPLSWAQRLFVRAQNMSVSGEVDCKLFVTVAQSFLATEAQRFVSQNKPGPDRRRSSIADADFSMLDGASGTRGDVEDGEEEEGASDAAGESKPVAAVDG